VQPSGQSVSSTTPRDMAAALRHTQNSILREIIAPSLRAASAQPCAPDATAAPAATQAASDATIALARLEAAAPGACAAFVAQLLSAAGGASGDEEMAQLRALVQQVAATAKAGVLSACPRICCFFALRVCAAACVCR
jgi:hypothetical protein